MKISHEWFDHLDKLNDKQMSELKQFLGNHTIVGTYLETESDASLLVYEKS